MISNKIISILSEMLGVEAEDISGDDSFNEDLHMGSAEMSDFAHILENNGINIDPEDLSTVETVGELIEMIEDDD